MRDAGPSSEGLQIEVFEDVEALEADREQWLEVHRKSRDRALCLSWSWLSSWLRVYWRPKDRLLTGRFSLPSGEVVGYAPFYVRSDPLVRTLRFVGTGEPERDEVASEFCDLLAVDGYENRVAAVTARFLGDARRAFDRIVLSNVLESSTVAGSLVPELDRQFRRYLWRQDGVRYCADLSAADSLPRRSRRARGTAERRREAAGGYLAVDTSGTWQAAWDALRELHGKLWQRRGQRGVFASRDFLAFHGTLARLADVHGDVGIRLYSYLVGHSRIAVLYNIRCGDTEYYYQSGWNPERRDLMPMICLHHHAQRLGLGDGLCRYDYMKGGGRNSYKADYADRCGTVLQIGLVRNSKASCWRTRGQRLMERITARLVARWRRGIHAGQNPGIVSE